VEQIALVKLFGVVVVMDVVDALLDERVGVIHVVEVPNHLFALRPILELRSPQHTPHRGRLARMHRQQHPLALWLLAEMGPSLDGGEGTSWPSVSS
jgi:hypothetical protein